MFSPNSRACTAQSAHSSSLYGVAMISIFSSVKTTIIKGTLLNEKHLVVFLFEAEPNFLNETILWRNLDYYCFETLMVIEHHDFSFEPFIFLSLSLSLTHTHIHAHKRTHQLARTLTLAMANQHSSAHFSSKNTVIFNYKILEIISLIKQQP